MDVLDIFIIIWVLAWGAWYLYNTTYNPAISGNNDDAFAKDKLVKYLAQAQKNLIIFDDGNVSEDFASIYNDNSIIDKLRNKLKQNSIFKLNMHFNCKENLAVNTLSSEFPEQVHIKYNPYNRKDGEWHFKLFDDGNICYASCHKLNEVNRAFAIYKKNIFSAYHPDVVAYKKSFNEQNRDFL